MDDKLISSINYDTSDNEEIKILCSNCRKKTNHKVVKSVRKNWNYDDGEILGYIDYFIVKCMGCDMYSFCQISGDSETYHHEVDGNGKDLTVYDDEISQYPQIDTSYRQIKSFQSMPTEIKDAYKETYNALTNNLTKLGAAGTRIIVELVCLSKGIARGTLEQKIDKLHTKGFVTETIRDILHNVRIFGNSSVHTLLTPDKKELEIAWEAVSTLLDAVYGAEDTKQRYEFAKLHLKKVN